MGDSVRRPSSRTEDDRLHRTYVALDRGRGLEITADDSREIRLHRPSLRPLLEQMLMRPQYPRKVFVANVPGLSEQVLSAALADRQKRAFDIDWLAMQDDGFLLDFIDGLVAQRELTPEAKRIIRANQLAEITRLMHLIGVRQEDR